MEGKYILTAAVPQNLDICLDIILQGKSFQREQGFIQWTDDYPNRSTIEEDIEKGIGYVVKAENRIAGYMCIDFSGEPAYENIEGKWHSDLPYGVIHRMAFDKAFRGIGLADITFSLIEKFCLKKGVSYIRIDTDFPNKRMQHILKKNGFKNCGVITLRGSGRLAFDKLF